MDGVDRIMRTGGVVPAVAAKQGAEQRLIAVQQSYQQALQDRKGRGFRLVWHAGLAAFAMNVARDCSSVKSGLPLRALKYVFLPPLHAQLVEQTIESRDHRLILHRRQAGTGQNHDIEGRKIHVAQPERFPAQSLDPVARNGTADIFFGNDQAQSGTGLIVVDCQHQQTATGNPILRLLENLAEIPGVHQPVALGQPKIHSGIPVSGFDAVRPNGRPDEGKQGLSGSQAGTAFGAAAGDNLAAFLGCHAGTKAVGSFALDDAGLKCTLHVGS
jgi:hypothetical protein